MRRLGTDPAPTLTDIATQAIAIHQYRRRVEESRATRAPGDPTLTCQEELLDRYQRKLAQTIEQFMTATGEIDGPDRPDRPVRIPARRHRKAGRRALPKAPRAAHV